MHLPESVPHPWRGLRPWKRHSLVLLVAGFIYVGVGFTYVLAEPNPSRATALQVAFSWWGIEGWGACFMFAGLLSIISTRWPPISKTWGYMVMTGLSGGWAAFYLTAIVIFDSPATNLSAVLLWSLIAFIWWAISGLKDPEEEARGIPGYIEETLLGGEA